MSKPLLQTAFYKKLWIPLSILWLVAVCIQLWLDINRIDALPTPSFIIRSDVSTQSIKNSQTQNSQTSQNHVSPQAIFSQQFISDPKDAPSVHSATATLLNDNAIQVMWFAGQREGAKNVAIYGSQMDLATGQWSKPKVILTREMVEQQSHTYLRKLGNPVLYQASNGTVHLFVVGVSLGGWATSKIYHFQATDGQNYRFKQILPLSPLANISHLVRATPVGLQDGGFYLPIYHELARKFDIILRFDAEGNLITWQRPNHLVGVLQPWLTATSEQDCIAVYRNRARTDNPLLVQYCQKGGMAWQSPIATNIPNDNNSLNVAWFDKQALLVHNQIKGHNDRYYLNLSKLDLNNNRVDKLALLDQTLTDGEVSYPTTLVVGDEVHIFYTYDRKQIRHLRFNRAWLKSLMIK